MAPAHLGTSENYPLILPIIIIEPQARDLSGPDPVHRKDYEDRMISSHRRLMSRRGIENFLHDLPSRAGW